MKYLLLLTFLALFTFTTGCRAPECQQMLQCCSALEELEGIGGACVMAKDTRDPTTCRAVVRNLEYMLVDRDQEIPQECK